MSVLAVDIEDCPEGLLPAHRHDHPHACFVLGGAMVDRCWSQRNAPAVTGDMLLNPGGVDHEIEVGGEGLICVIVEWASDRLFDSFRRIHAAPLRDKINMLADLRARKNPARKIIADREIAAVIGLAVNDCSPEDAPDWLGEARNEIERSGAEFSIATLARRAGVHRATLTKRFQANFGAAPEQYRMIAKLERAADLMISGAPLAAAAAEAGFADQAHFNRAWRRYLGSTPKAWLRESDNHSRNFPENAV